MAYLIRRKEPLVAEVRRIMVEQNRGALRLLQGWRLDPRTHVHRARQAFKRMRALLRLVRPGARYVYDVENRFYRDLGRRLTYARDTEAVIEALGLLEPRVSGPLAQESLRMLRIGLEQRAAREHDCSTGQLAVVIVEGCESLSAAAKRLRRLPLDELRRKDLRGSVQDTVARCATALAAASQTRAPDEFHALRKHVKCAYHQARLLQELMPGWAAQRGPVLGRLGEALGQYHDLMVLDSVLSREADDLGMDLHLRAIRNAVRDTAAELAAESLRTAPELFDVAAVAGVSMAHRSPKRHQR